MVHAAPVLEPADRLTEAARFHDYRNASNPLADGSLEAIPGGRFCP